ncbi:MAG: mechanosensitive ion channel family protein, partial [Candidatus Obscuribacterales bacterium]|nr:mechanosensitive ion channel family protein [Candidatus Obscuribacterales bacterium]
MLRKTVLENKLFLTSLILAICLGLCLSGRTLAQSSLSDTAQVVPDSENGQESTKESTSNSPIKEKNPVSKRKQTNLAAEADRKTTADPPLNHQKLLKDLPAPAQAGSHEQDSARHQTGAAPLETGAEDLSTQDKNQESHDEPLQNEPDAVDEKQKAAEQAKELNEVPNRIARRIAQRISEPERPRYKKRPSQKNWDDYIDDATDWFMTPGLQILLIVALTLFGLKTINLFAKNLFTLFTRNKEGSEIKKRADTLSSVVRYILIIVVSGVGGMMILKELGIDIGPILAGAGVLGVAVGFGAQSLVKDIISGFFILFEDQIRVGDVVQIADKSGCVEKVTLRMVILRDLHGNVHFIPNGGISVVTNMTKTYSRYVFDIGVAYKEDVDEVIEVMKQVDEDLRSDPDFQDDILEPLEVMGLQRFDNSAVIIRARTMTKPIKQWGVGREFNKRLKR